MDWPLSLRIAAVVVLDAVLLFGLLAIPLGLSGNFIILGAALVTALLTRFALIGWVALVVMTGSTILGEVVESLLGSLMARRYGATKWGMSGAFFGAWGGALLGGAIGAALGSLILPLVGTLIGSFIGTAAGAILMEVGRGSTRGDGMRAGYGAFLGKTLASAFKLAIGIAMVVYIAIRVH
ncbi:MAG: DUF456 family protein [Candidatus Eisenbacteria bacterium]|nr:DUF456 family protein [Candidatus Eisenbacteria bacterium]